MAGIALREPVHLVIHPDEPIRSVDDAVKVIERHAGDPQTPEAQALMLELTRARTPQEIERAARIFREWAADQGLLLVPPEDRNSKP
jgi:hypothetical protein